jgi:hypothetical protein
MADFRLHLPDGKGIMASVDERGVLSFVIEAGPGCAIRGSEMFDLMMRVFGDQIESILGVWRKGFQGRPSTNLDKINELTGNGLSLELAVPQAWTATRASRWGFTNLTINKADGKPGHYVKIDVMFQKSGGTQ